MRVLVTRPGEDGTALAEILGARGIESIIEPLLTIKQIEGPALELGNVQALLLTSANGVRALARRTERRDIPVYAVGDATATTARSSGFVQVHSAAGNVETLVELVTEMLKPKAGPLLHIAGSAVAGDLIALVEAAGFECTREVLYEAVVERSLMSSTIAAIKDAHIDIVTLYSPRSAEIFVELVRKARLVRSCQNIIALCLSQAVADKISELHWQEVHIAKEPNQDALLDLLTELIGGSHNDASLAEKSEEMTDQDVPADLPPINAVDGNTMTHRVAPIQRRQGGTARTVFITLLVAAVLVGAGLASKPLWLPKFQAFAPVLFKASATDVKITNLNGRLKALESAQQVPDLQSLQQERKRLQTKLDVTLDRLDTLESSIGSVKKMIDAVNTEPGNGAAKTLEQLSSRLQKLEAENSNFRTIYQTKDGKTLNTLAEEVAALEKKVPNIVGDTQSSQARALVLSIGQMRESVRAGRSFESELAALIALVEKNDNIKIALTDSLNQLAKISTTGAPSLQILQSQFDELAGKIVQVGLMPTDGGWVQRTLARLTESVKWRRTDNLAGNGVEAIVARAERALKSRDVVKAIKELSILEENPAALTKEWLVGAEAYMIAEKALAELQTRAVAQMAAGQ
jgi:uroporphyrinogen-III synthase